VIFSYFLSLASLIFASCSSFFFDSSAKFLSQFNFQLPNSSKSVSKHKTHKTIHKCFKLNDLFLLQSKLPAYRMIPWMIGLSNSVFSNVITSFPSWIAPWHGYPLYDTIPLAYLNSMYSSCATNLPDFANISNPVMARCSPSLIWKTLFPGLSKNISQNFKINVYGPSFSKASW